MRKFNPCNGEIIQTKFHPATSAYNSNGCCQHWPSFAEAYVADNFVSVVQTGEETDAETIARAKGMYLRGIRGMYGFTGEA